MSAPLKRKDEDDDDDKPLPRNKKLLAQPAVALLRPSSSPAKQEGDEVAPDDDDDEPIVLRRPTVTLEGLRADLRAAQARVKALERAVAAEEARLAPTRAPKAFQLGYAPDELLSWRDPAWPESETVGTGIDDAVRLLREALAAAGVDPLRVSLRIDNRKTQSLGSVELAGPDRREIRLLLHNQLIARTQRPSVEAAAAYLADTARALLGAPGSLLDALARLPRLALPRLIAFHAYRGRVATLRDGEERVLTNEDIQQLVQLAVARIDNPLCDASRIRFNRKLQTHAYQLKRSCVCLRPGFIFTNPARNVFNKILFALCDWLIAIHSPQIPRASRAEEVDALVARLGGRVEHGFYTPVRS